MHPARSGGGGRCSSLDAPKRVVRVCWKHEAETLSQSDHTTAQSYNLLGGLFSVPPTRVGGLNVLNDTRSVSGGVLNYPSCSFSYFHS